MSDITSSGPSGARTVTAFFDTSDHASTARADLIAAGVPDSDITVVGSNAEHFTVAHKQSKGFWDTLGDFFMPDDDRRAYAEGLRRGGYAVSVKASGTLYDLAIDVLDRDGAVDLDERAMNWEREGWSRSGEEGANPGSTTYAPADASTAGFGGSYAGEDGIAHVDEATNPDVRERIGAGTASQTAPAPTGGPQTYGKGATPEDDQKADMVEGRPGDADNLFGRRDLTHGRNRVRSYIVDDGSV